MSISSPKLSFLICLYALYIGLASSQHVKDSKIHYYSPTKPTLFSGNATTHSVTTSIGNTTAPPSNSSNSWQGYIGAGVAVVFFGSNFVPVKKYDTGDGVFFQWILCVAIWMTGLIVNAVQSFPKFYGLAMLGGVLWSTGNMCVVPIIKTIGLGLGLLIWGSFNLLSGWASGRFGWFGLHKEIPNNTTFNYISIGLAMLSTVFWLFVESDTSTSGRQLEEDENRLLNSVIPEAEIIVPDSTDKEMEEDDESWTDRLSLRGKRIVGCLLSVFSGTLYGVSFAPVIHIKDNYKGASQKDLDYVFAHFCGILATSSVYFIIYCIIKKNKPKVYPSVILPGIISGWMWGAADIGWFIANEYLSEAVSFPIVTTGPGIIASLWGVFVYKEVKGRRNFIIMGIAYSLTITAAVFAGLSKK
uniref:transmembrane protein 144-like n=1 Tax=Styela clava TaxID=7725 RepID=UPI00193A53E9|nr:transmembrane protein 144-like [Styela clava]